MRNQDRVDKALKRPLRTIGPLGNGAVRSGRFSAAYPGSAPRPGSDGKWWGARRALLLFVLFAVVALNAVAYRQAYVMTHYTAVGPATAGPGVIGGLAKLAALALGVNVPRPENTHTPRDWGLAYET